MIKILNKGQVIVLIIILIKMTLQQQDEIKMQMQIMEPKTLASLYLNHSIDYTIANFGMIPYDTQLVGHAKRAIPLDGCSNVTNEKVSPILIMYRGNCTFAQKALNAQMRGAKMLIVVDSINEFENSLIIVGDNIHTGVNIPTVMISKQDGDNLQYYLDQTDAANEITFFVKFPSLVKDKESHVRLWVSSSDYKSMNTAMKMLDIYRDEYRNDTNVFFEIKFVYYFSVYAQSQNYTNDMEDCVCGGRYCSPDPDFNGPLTGRDIVMENLNQKCIYKQSQDLYYKYLQEYTNNCFKFDYIVSNFNDCVSNITKFFNINVTSCVSDSFTEKQNRFTSGDNLVIKQDRDLFQKSDLHSFPQIQINGVLYKGNLQGQAIVQAICQSITHENMPSHCYQYSNEIIVDSQQSLQQSTSSIVTLVFIISIIIIIISLICFRRMFKREMAQEMQMQVNSAISQYYALNDKTNIEVKTI